MVEDKNGVQVLFRQIAGALARRIVWYVKEGDQLDTAEEFGFPKDGGRQLQALTGGTDGDGITDFGLDLHDV